LIDRQIERLRGGYPLWPPRPNRPPGQRGIRLKRLVGIFLLFAATANLVWAKKITVQELKQTLTSLHQAYTSDENVANKLKEFELSEELTGSARSGLAQFLPGPLSVEQIDILQGRSSILAPPSADLPATTSPDAATQKEILAKAQDYVAKNYMQNPRMTATKTISRFQDDAGNTSNTPGLTVPGPNTFTRFLDSRTDQVESEKGIEKPSASKNKTRWGQNGQISEGEPGPNLSAVLQEASAGGKLDWLRWETIDGKQIAVFSFAVDKKKSHFDVNYCCFADTETETNIAAPGPGPTGAQGDIQSLTSWKLFKKVVPYHGELFVEPNTGLIVRAITCAEMKPTDLVHQEVMRIDYEQVVVGGKEYMLPVDSFTINEVVPNGNSNFASYSVRHTLFSVKYQGYH
jgi:hypothetical protein